MSFDGLGRNGHPLFVPNNLSRQKGSAFTLLAILFFTLLPTASIFAQSARAPSATTIFNADFENGTGDNAWTVSGDATAGAWDRGIQPAYSAGNFQVQLAPVSGSTLATGLDPDNTTVGGDVDGGITTAQSPSFVLPSNQKIDLSFDYYFGANAAQATSFFRVSVVDASNDTILLEVYDSDFRTHGVNALWTPHTANLSDFGGSTVYLRADAQDSDGLVLEAAIDNVLVTHEAHNELSGQVWNDLDSDGIFDADEQGLESVFVELLDANQLAVDDPALPGFQAATRLTDATGGYRFADLPPGTYRVRIPTPPGAYAISSPNTVTADNQVDNDDNGIQSEDGRMVLSPPIALAIGEVDDTIDLGLVTTPELPQFVYTAVPVFEWANVDNSNGEIWNVTDTSRTWTKNYTDIYGNPQSVDITMEIVDPDNRNDDLDLHDAGSHPFDPAGGAAPFPGSTETDNVVGDGSIVDPWDSDLSPLLTQTNGGYGPDFLTFGIKTEDSLERVTLRFTFSKVVRISDLAVSDIDASGFGYSAYGGNNGLLSIYESPGNSYQDRVEVYAWRDGVPVAVTFTPGGNLTFADGTSIADYDDEENLNVTPDTVSSETSFSTADGITVMEIVYSNGSEDTVNERNKPTHYDWWSAGDGGTTFGASDDHGIRISGFGLVAADSGNISGNVFVDTNNDDAGDVPLAGVTLQLQDTNGNPVNDALGNPVLPVTTDSNGYYLFTNLAPNDYRVVEVQPTGYSSVVDGDTTDAGDDATNTDTLDDFIPVSIVVGETDTGNDFVEERTATLGNYVWLDENGDGVQDAGEDGIPGATVTLTPPAGVDLGNGVGVAITTTTDLNGGYLFTNLPPVDGYTVTVDTASLPSGLAANPTYDENSGTVNPDSTTIVDLSPGEEHLTADFGYNWTSPTDTNNPGGSPTGAIGDRIWLDSDGDGVQDAGEIGLAGVPVQLFYDADGDGVADDPYPGGTTTTDEHGNYIFDDLPAGIYNVVVTTPPTGYTQTGDPDDFGTVAGNPDNRTSNPIVLAPGDVFVNADFGYQPNVGGSDIGDTIYFDSDGDGIEDAGEPGIAGVTVALLDGNGNVLATTITDATGNYLFPNLPAGDYQIVVTDTNNVLGELIPSGNPDGGEPDNQGAVITLNGSDDNLDQDFGYKPFGHDSGDGLIGDTVFLDIDGNGTQDGNELGIEGVTVTLTDINGNVIGITTTDENGHYSFGNLDPTATYTVRVDTSTLPNGLFISADPDATLDSTSVVNLGAAGTDGVNDPDGDNGINLGQDFGYTADDPATDVIDESNTLSGTIWQDTDADGTLEGGEAGRFENVTVALYDTNGNLIATTTTDANGDYSFVGLPDGRYIVDVTDDNNVLAGNWHSDGPNDGANNNSQDDVYSVDLDSAGASDAGVTNETADFGYYSQPGAVGNLVWEDLNGDGDVDFGEPGIAGVPVTLTISYPNGQSVTLTQTTSDGTQDVNGDGTIDPLGYYSFENLLSDEDFNGVDGANPTYTLTVGDVTGLSSTYDGTPDATGVGNGTDDNADNPAGEIAAPVQGGRDDTNDFGFTAAAVELGAIGNYVWLDENGDGVQDAGERGIEGVIVTLTPPGSVDLGNGLGVAITTTTDSNGGYLFAGLASADYTVSIDTNQPALANATYTQANRTGQDYGNQNPAGYVVSLQSGEVDLTADFGFNYGNSDGNTGFGALGDRIWVDLDGDGVQDPNELGLEGIVVELFDADGNSVGTRTTDENGLYLFEDLRVGAYTVVVNNPPAGWTATGDPDHYGTTGTSNNTTDFPIVIAPGDFVQTIDFGYQPPAGEYDNSIGDTIWLDADRDGAQNGDEPGLAGVTVALLNSDGEVIATTVTADDGTYAFNNLPDGTYTVWVNDTNGVLTGLEQTFDNDVANGDTLVLDNRSTVSVSNGETNNAQDFGYVPPAHQAGNGIIGDTVWYDLDGDGVQDPGEEGIPNVSVTLTYPNGTVVTTTTDSEGNYYFPNLPVDGDGETYTITVVTSTLPGGVSQTFDDDGVGTPNTSSVTLTTADPTDFDQDFAYNGINSLSGTIWEDTDADGTLEGAEAGRFENVSVKLVDSNGDVIATTTTDATGDYSFANLPDGVFTVVVEDANGVLDGYWHSDGPNDGANNNSQTDPYVVDLDSAGANATPVTNETADFGYYVQPGAVGNLFWEDTNSDGLFNNGETGIAGVVITLTIDYPSGDSIVLTTTTSDGSTDVDGDGVIDPVGSYSFNNLLLDEDYNGVGTFGTDEPTYTLTAGTPNGFITTYDDSADNTGIGNGTDNNADNPNGEVAFPPQGSADNTNDFGVNQTVIIGDRIWLEADGDGQIGVLEDVDPVEGAIITAIGANGVVYTTTSAADGSYSLTVPANSTYTVTVSPPLGLAPSTVINNAGNNQNHDSTGTVVTVGTTDDNTIDFAFTTGYEVGNLVWIDTEPTANGTYTTTDTLVDGAEVQLFRVTVGVPELTPFRTTTTANGAYQFSNLPAGDYQVRIAPEEFQSGGALFDAGEGVPFNVSPNGGGGSDDDTGHDGNTPISPQLFGVSSDTFTLGGAAPTGEDPHGLNSPLPDDQVDWTVDFAFAMPSATAVTMSNLSVGQSASLIVWVALLSVLTGLLIMRRRQM